MAARELSPGRTGRNRIRTPVSLRQFRLRPMETSITQAADIQCISLGKSIIALVEGRGKINMRIPFPKHLYAPLAWWFRQLRWSITWREARQMGGRTQDYVTAYHELALDFELSTRAILSRGNWGSKAQAMIQAFRALFKLLRPNLNGVRGSFKQVFCPGGKTRHAITHGSRSTQIARNWPESTPNCIGGCRPGHRRQHLAGGPGSHILQQ